MTSDEERREVARRLRETGEELGSAALLWYHIAKALGVRTATDGETACDMLADLVEPSCNRAALLELADDIEREAGRFGDMGFLKFLDLGTEWAARIRGAVGR